MKRTFSLIIFVYINFFFISCKNNQKSIPQLNTDTINILDHSEKIILDLDEKSYDTLSYISIIDEQSIKINDNSKIIFLSKPTSCIVDNDSIIIVDSGQNCILTLDKSLNFGRKIGRFGRAPLEFNNPFSIAKNDFLYLVHDVSNARIQILDSKLKYISSVPTSSMPFTSNFCITKNNVYLPNQDLTKIDIYTITKSNHPLVYHSTVSFPKRTSGFKLHLLNTMKFTQIDDSTLCFYYISFPDLIFTDLLGRTKSVLEFNSAEIKHFQKDFYDEEQGGIKILIQDIKVSGNLIFVAMGQRILILEKNGKYISLKKKYIIKSKECIVRELNIYENNIYICDWSSSKIFCYSIDNNKKEGLK
jgi:hypothetical protein